MVSTKKYFLLSIILSTIAIATFSFMQQSIGGTYLPFTMSNMLLPNLGINSYFYVDSTTIIAYVALMKILYLVLGTDVLMLARISGICSFIAIIFSYNLLASVLPGDPKVKVFVLNLYALLWLGLDISIINGYVFGFTIPLCFVILFFLLSKYTQKNYIPMFLIAFISWISLGFFWHTLHTLTLILICSYLLIIPNLSNITVNENKIKWNLLALIIIIYIFTWFSLRDSTVSQIFNQNIEFNLNSIFGKGSFAGDYTYVSLIPYHYIDLIRYFAYLILYTIMGAISIKSLVTIIKKKEFIRDHTLVVFLLISDLLFQSIYFFATGTMSPRILLLLSYPLMLILIMSKSISDSNYICSTIRIFVSLFLVLSLMITAMPGLYSYIVEQPETNLNMDIYNSNFYWIMDHSNTINLTSDSNTLGNYILLYSNSGLYNTKKIYFESIGYGKYKCIIESDFKTNNDNLLLTNIVLHKKHIKFSSLEAWNKFEPLSEFQISQNKNLNLVYNDGRILISK